MYALKITSTAIKMQEHLLHTVNFMFSLYKKNNLYIIDNYTYTYVVVSNNSNTYYIIDERKFICALVFA